MREMADAPEPLQLSLAYVDADEVPILTCNNVVVQAHAEEEFILLLGQIAPPILLGSPEEQRAQAEGLEYVPVHVVARVGMTRHRVQEMIRALEDAARKYDEAMEGRES